MIEYIKTNHNHIHPYIDMVGERIQFFESEHLETLQYEINEFLANLPEDFAEFIMLDHNNSWTQFLVVYRLKKSESEMMAMVDAITEEEKRKKAEEDARQFSDEDIKKLVEENKKKILLKEKKEEEEGAKK